ncbi:MAG: hypothetical protein RI558_05530 [Psychroflexus sp.]|nr:hypothetical protein [Psychroflexus sp.]MDR9449069.1 hypothetical protein [Psychroflexus sp.]
MANLWDTDKTRARESTNAIERIYITMRHLFIRGFYKPMGVSGKTLRESLLTLRPEIYGTIAEDKVELNGLLYVVERLPRGIESCTYINLTSNEGYAQSHFQPIIPPKRRRNCYRIDDEQMNIEITRGRSEIYDILTHLTFMFVESHKIMNNVLVNDSGNVTRDWQKLKEAVDKTELNSKERDIAITHVANILGRTFSEVVAVYPQFATSQNPDQFIELIYKLGKLALNEEVKNDKRIITFSPVLRERLGHHIHGEIWANNIKDKLIAHDMFERDIHIISANMHSVMNTIYAAQVFPERCQEKGLLAVYQQLGQRKNQSMRDKISAFALKNGMTYINDHSGTNIDVQIFDLNKVAGLDDNFNVSSKVDYPVLIVMDYAFGEQAYETMEELLKPYEKADKKHFMPVDSISIMGKAGILKGVKGDIMIPNAHLFEGTADNYPLNNQLIKSDFEGYDLDVLSGAMMTVLGTSLQNRNILHFFHHSSWNVVGLEMEGAHYQKAIQASGKLRGNIKPNVKVRYAYYASDNPLQSGSTLASGGLGVTGVKPTYLITEKILQQILNS